jgi:hypothetical protein
MAGFHLAISNQYLQNADTNASAWRVKFYVLWSFMLLLKLLLAWHLQLFGDEAFYAWESSRLAWAYSDLPGLTAWLIRLGTTIGGCQPFAIRVPFLLIGALIPFLIVRIARHFSSEAQAWQAGVLSCCFPLLLPLGAMALPEAPLCLATLLSLDAILRLCEKSEWRYCFQLALGLAVGATTHYRFMIILLAGALGFFLSGGWRLYRDPKLLLALTIGACAWLPLVLYNEQHDFAGWQFQFHERNPWQFSNLGFLHLPVQAIVTTPVLYAALVWCLWHVFGYWRRGEKKMGLILGAAGLPIILFAGLAFFADQVRVSFHWPLQAYFPLIALLPFVIAEKFPDRHERVNAWITFTGLAGVGITFSYFLMAAVPGMAGALAGKKAYPDNFLGWNEISFATKSMLNDDEVLVADNFMLAAQLEVSFSGKREIYVLDHPLNKKHGRARQLEDWHVDNKSLLKLEKGRSVFIVIEETNIKEWRRDQWRAKLCQQFHELKFQKIIYGPGKGKSFSIFRGRLGANPNNACNTQISML